MLIKKACTRFVYRFIFKCKKKINKEKHLRIGYLKNEETEYSQVSWLIKMACVVKIKLFFYGLILL